MRSTLLFLLSLLSFCASAQILETKVRDSVKLDSIIPVADPKYREDQMYASVAYNMVQSKPGLYSQYSFSTALTVGFLRDMPINKKRTYAIAAGLGYSYNNIKHNFIVQPIENGVNSYQPVQEGSFDKNKLVLHYLEVPLELRWRNSDSISHKFWRVYLGVKVSYLFADKTLYKPGDSPPVKVRNDKNLNDFVYGAYISAGWNTWNFYAYYGLTPIYNNAPIVDSDQKLTLKSLNFGLIFYIL
ncbi:porin family protein [Flavobacterium sp. DG1-102-2]|uniref:porin family protein n=1 Tax=Flavobacterium sp. DG1-102-2 TaxID=3081663 RepID=UPI0029490E4E|nr:porin family protein [Flavobacterium sp. DG1-102-2]MDV6169451.1 porin family protein [Flavobacterium sp. DG1-102-2]